MLRRATLALAAALIGLAGFAGVTQSAQASTSAQTRLIRLLPPGCKVEENLGATAIDFVGRCRLGKVLREFPDEYLEATLAQIKVDRSTKGRKAWKLLTDKRFAKP